MLRPTVAFALSLSAWLALAGAAAAAEPVPAQALAGVERDVRVQQYVESAQRKREAGQFEEALGDLRAANALVKKTRGDGHPDQLPLLDLAAEILVENDKMQEAEGPLQKVVTMREALAREGQASQEVPLAASLLLLGKVHAALGKYESVVDMLKKAVRVLDTSLGPEHEKTFQARRELARSVEIFEQTLGADHPATLKALEELDEVQAALGDWTAAAANARRIIEVKRARFGAASPEALEAVMKLTDLIAHGGAADEAISIQAEAIAAAEAAAAPPAVLVPSLRHLGALHLATEDYSPAIDAYTRARDLAAAHLGADGAEPLIDRLHLVDVAQKRGDDDPWDAGFEQIVARLRELAGQGDPRAAEGLRLAAGDLLAADSFDRASELYREALALDERLLGPAHVDVAEDQLGLGRCLVGNGDTAAAESLLRTALQTMQREHGPAHAATLGVVTRLAECAVRAGDAKAAEKYVAQILERRVPRQGAHAEEEFCRLVDAAAGLCEKAGDAGKGGALRDQLVAIRRAQFGESHEHVADVLVAMANARQAARDYAAATAMYEAGIAIYETALGGEHPDIAAALLPLARAYRATGKNEVAEGVLRRALGIWEATVGPDHEVTLATVKPLALVVLALGREAEAIPLMERLLAGLDADPAADPVEVVKLLTKLAEVRESIGAAEAARRDLRRAIEIEMRLADAGRGGSATDLADIARLQQLLGDDEAAAENLARARDMAAKLPDAQDQIAKIEATAKPARKPAAAALTADKPAPPPAVSSAAVIAAAKSKYRLGKRNEARGLLEKALGEIRGGDAARDLERADLLVALADMRPRATDYDAAAVLYEEALKITIERERSSSPRALVVALRLLGIRQAQGQEQTAARLVDDVEKGAKQVFAGAPSAEAMDEVREAVRRAEAVALAAGDRKTARRLVEIGLALTGRPDRRATLAAIDTLAVLLSSGRSSSAAALRTRLLDTELLNARRDDPLSARFILHRGIAAEQAGDLAAAEQDYRQALSLDEATHGREHPLVAVDLLRIAGARELAGDRPAATEARSRAAAIAEQAARTARPDALPDLRTLAAALATAGQTDAATKLLKGMVDAQLRSDGAKSLEVARLLGDSADVFRKRGNAGRAAELLSEAVAIADAVVGAGHHETLALAAKLEQLSRFGAADQFATRKSVPLAPADAAVATATVPADPAAAGSAEASRARPAPAVPRDSGLDATLAEIAQTVADGRLTAALERYKELGQETWKEHGADDLRVAQVALPYVHALVECGDLRKARTLADRALATRMQTLGSDHPDVAEALLAGAAVDAANRDFVRAWAGYARARAILAAAGNDRIAVRRALVEAASELGDVREVIDEAERLLVGRAADDEPRMAAALRSLLCDALLAAGATDRAAAVARQLAPNRAPDQPADAAAAPDLVCLARAEQASGSSEWSRTADAAEAVISPALEAASAEGVAPRLIRAGSELAALRARTGDAAGGLLLAERAAAAAERSLPARHRERLRADRTLAELLTETGSPDRATPLVEGAGNGAVDPGVREAVLRHFGAAATLPL